MMQSRAIALLIVLGLVVISFAAPPTDGTSLGDTNRLNVGKGTDDNVEDLGEDNMRSVAPSNMQPAEKSGAGGDISNGVSEYLASMREEQKRCPRQSLRCPGDKRDGDNSKARTESAETPPAKLFNLTQMTDGANYVAKLKRIRPSYQHSVQIIAGTSSPGRRDGVGSQAKFQFQGRRACGLGFSGESLGGVLQPDSALYVSTFGPLRRIALGTTAAKTTVTTIQGKARYDGGVAVIQEGPQDVVYYGDSMGGRGVGHASISQLTFHRNESKVASKTRHLTQRDLCKLSQRSCSTVFDISAVRTPKGAEHHVYTAYNVYKGSVARTVTKKADNYTSATTTFMTKDTRRYGQGGITRLAAVHDAQTGSDFVLVPMVSSTYDKKIVLHRYVINLVIFQVSPSGKVKRLRINIRKNPMGHCTGIAASSSVSGVTVWIADSTTSSVWQLVLPWKVLRNSKIELGEDDDIGSRWHRSRSPPPLYTASVQLVSRSEFGLSRVNALVFGGSTANIYTIQGYDVISVKTSLGISCSQNEWMSSELDGWSDLKNMELGTAIPIVAALRQGGTGETCRNVTSGNSWRLNCTSRFIEGGETEWKFQAMRKFRTTYQDKSTLVKNMMCIAQSKLGGNQNVPGWEAGEEKCCVSKYACHWTHHSKVPTKRECTCSETEQNGLSLANQLKMW